MKGRILAIDWGEKKLGLCISDPFNKYGILLEPIENIKYNVFDYIYNLINEKCVKVIVFGLPDYLDGRSSSVSKKVKDFIFELDDFLFKKGIRELKIDTINEYFSTQDAYNFIEDKYSKFKSNKSSKKKSEEFKKYKDSLAAKIILEEYLIKTKYNT
ncbi:MAG: RuvX/YqgF family protein [Spirochaetes bacterium]|nr:RuvX/YqgF family protein [Spirochaetota bacterium]